MRPAQLQAVLFKMLRELLALSKRWPDTLDEIYLL